MYFILMATWMLFHHQNLNYMIMEKMGDLPNHLDSSFLQVSWRVLHKNMGFIIVMITTTGGVAFADTTPRNCETCLGVHLLF